VRDPADKPGYLQTLRTTARRAGSEVCQPSNIISYITSLGKVISILNQSKS
jgi:hypothetical protein